MSRERSPGKSGETNNALNTVFGTVRVVDQGKMGDCSDELTQTALIFIPKLAGKCKPNSPSARLRPISNFSSVPVDRRVQ